MTPAPQNMQDIVNLKNFAYQAKYRADVAHYKALADEWTKDATTAIQSGYPAQPFNNPVPRLIVATLDASGIREDYAPADASLIPELPKVPPPPKPTDVFGSIIGNSLEKKQDQDIAEILRISRGLEAVFLKPPAGA
jgi:hypothetical protein